VASNNSKYFRSVKKTTNIYRLLKETLRFEWYAVVTTVGVHYSYLESRKSDG
jgi:hypothetical protein